MTRQDGSSMQVQEGNNGDTATADESDKISPSLPGTLHENVPANESFFVPSSREGNSSPMKSGSSFPGCSLHMNNDKSGGFVVFEESQGLLSMPTAGTWILSADDNIIAAPFPLITEKEAKFLTPVYKLKDNPLDNIEEDWFDSGLGGEENVTPMDCQPALNSASEKSVRNVEHQQEADRNDSLILAGSFQFFSPVKKNLIKDQNSSDSSLNSEIDKELNEPDLTEPFHLTKMVEELETLQARRRLPPESPRTPFSMMTSSRMPMQQLLSPIRHEGPTPIVSSPGRLTTSPPKFFQPWKSSSPKGKRVLEMSSRRSLSILEKFRKICRSAALRDDFVSMEASEAELEVDVKRQRLSSS